MEGRHPAALWGLAVFSAKGAKSYSPVNARNGVGHQVKLVEGIIPDVLLCARISEKCYINVAVTSGICCSKYSSLWGFNSVYLGKRLDKITFDFRILSGPDFRMPSPKKYNLLTNRKLLNYIHINDKIDQNFIKQRLSA